MTHRSLPRISAVATAIIAASVIAATDQPGGETFSATASVKTAAGAAATAPVTIVVSRLMPQKEADPLVKAFTDGGVAALRKALSGVAPTGSVQVGSGKPTPARIAIERKTDKGRLLTIVTDQPILFVGAGMPNAKPKEGYDLGVVDIEVDGSGSGTGMMAPAAKVAVKQGAFVVQDYGSESVRLTDVKK